MKKWNAPEVAELNISETANGLVHSPWETDNLFHDDAAHQKGDETPDTTS